MRRQKSSASALLFHVGTEKAEKSKEEFLKASFFVELRHTSQGSSEILLTTLFPFREAAQQMLVTVMCTNLYL